VFRTCLLLHECGEAIELLRPKALIAIEPIHRLLHGFGSEMAGDGAPLLAARDETRIREHVEMLHHGGK
jgi:hypothetical protein